MKWLIVLFLLLLVACSRTNLYSDLKVPDCDNHTQGEKDICYNNLAIKMNDPGICMQIEEDSYRKWCLNFTKP